MSIAIMFNMTITISISLATSNKY